MIDSWEKVQKVLACTWEETTGVAAMWPIDQVREFEQFPCARMDFLSIDQIGTPEICYIEDPDLPPEKELIPTAFVQHRVVWNIQVETDDCRPSKSAWAYLERFRGVLFLDSIVDRFTNCGVALERPQVTNNLGPNSETGAATRASMDVALTVHTEIKDCAITYIEKVGVASNLLDETGTPYPPEIQFDEVFQ